MENKIKIKRQREFLKDLDLTLKFNPTIQSKAKNTDITIDDDSLPFVPFSQANAAPTTKSRKTAKI